MRALAVCCVGCVDPDSEWSPMGTRAHSTDASRNRRCRKGLEPLRHLSKTTGPRSLRVFRVAVPCTEVTKPCPGHNRSEGSCTHGAPGSVPIDTVPVAHPCPRTWPAAQWQPAHMFPERSDTATAGPPALAGRIPVPAAAGVDDGVAHVAAVSASQSDQAGECVGSARRDGARIRDQSSRPRGGSSDGGGPDRRLTRGRLGDILKRSGRHRRRSKQARLAIPAVGCGAVRSDRGRRPDDP